MIFLSYSRENFQEALALQTELHSNGYALLKDPPLIEGDPFWRQKIKKAWTNCELMVIIWSVYAMRSPWVDQEVRAFAGLRVFVMLDQTIMPGYYEGVRIKQNEILIYLKQFNLKKEKTGVTKDLSTAEVMEKRVLRMKEWEDELNKLIYLKKNIYPPVRISEDEWIWLNDIVFRPIPKASQGLKPGEAVKLLSSTPVTNKEFFDFTVQSNWPIPSIWANEEFKNDKLPVMGVSWFDAMAYASWFGATLPTINDWEHAASSGHENIIYATNDNSLSFDNCFFLRAFGEEHPVDPTNFPSNPGGFYGMSGNTWDWCRSRLGLHFAIKGGGYMDSRRFCRIDAGYRNSPIDRDCCVGFRIQYEITIG